MTARATAEALLEVRDLRVTVSARDGVIVAVKSASFDVQPGQSLGLVGESGSGKSLTALAVMGLLPSSARVESGEIVYRGRDLLALSDRERRQLRGREISMILQGASSSLDPCYRVGEQVVETIRTGQGRGRRRRARREAAIELLESVRLPEARRRLLDFPHMLSGGMRQRVAGAIAMAASPQLLIADEPTTSLDPTVQLQYLDWLQWLQQEHGIAILLIAHDFGIVAKMCDDVAVMYSGEIVERGPIGPLLADPAHPYTQGMVRSVPRLDGPVTRLPSIEGAPPDPRETVVGCAFAPRCGSCRDLCREASPPPTRMDERHDVRCWIARGFSA